MNYRRVQFSVTFIVTKQLLKPVLIASGRLYIVCPRRLGPFYVVSYYISPIKTFWTCITTINEKLLLFYL